METFNERGWSMPRFRPTPATITPHKKLSKSEVSGFLDHNHAKVFRTGDQVGHQAIAVFDPQPALRPDFRSARCLHLIQKRFSSPVADGVKQKWPIVL